VFVPGKGYIVVEEAAPNDKGLLLLYTILHSTTSGMKRHFWLHQTVLQAIETTLPFSSWGCTLQRKRMTMIAALWQVACMLISNRMICPSEKLLHCISELPKAWLQ
jgi:hypothetical protein